MAVRLSADNQDFTRTLSLGTVSTYTVAGWVKISVDRNDWSCMWCLDDNSTSNYELVETDTTGTQFKFITDNASSGINLGAATAGIWMFIGISRSSSAGTGYWRGEADASFATAALTGAGASVTGTTLRFGESIFGGEWLNGALAAVKVWNGVALTADEMWAESAQYQPVRTAGLLAYYPFLRTETVDYSGGARTLSGGSGTSTEAGPGIVWDNQASPIPDYPDTVPIPPGAYFLAL